VGVPGTGPNPAPFVLYVFPEEPQLGHVQRQNFFIGTSCMPMPLGNGNPYPPPYTLANSAGYENILGYPILHWLGPAPCTVLNLPAGLPEGYYTFQGYIFDNASSSAANLSLTNAIVLKVQ
jgi:hypothetical protein